MPEFLPFRGLRYGHDDLAAVTAPPYDVIDDDERAVLVGRSPHNAVGCCSPRATTTAPPRELASVAAPTARSSATRSPAFYGYRMEFTDDHGRRRAHRRRHRRARRCPSAAGEGDVLPHERTMPKAKSDRLALDPGHPGEPRPDLGPDPGDRACRSPAARPVAVTTDDLGVQHSLRPITDAATDRRDPPGRRLGAARARRRPPPVRDRDRVPQRADRGRRRDRGRRPGDVPRGRAGRRPALGPADPPPAQRRRRSRRRCGPRSRQRSRVEDLGPNDAGGRRAARAAACATRAASAWSTRPASPGWSPTPARRAAATRDLPEALRDVPSAWFDELAAPALDGVEVTFRADAQTVAALVAKGAADAAILLPPVTVEQIRAAALAGIRMPQKTTYFAPKPRSGLVYRPLDEVDPA